MSTCGDIQATGDAILAAARLLRANGAPADMARALYAYNSSHRYVRAGQRLRQPAPGEPADLPGLLPPAGLLRRAPPARGLSGPAGHRSSG